MTQNATLKTPYSEGDQPQYISLSFGKNSVLVPQSSIVSIEALSDLYCDDTSDSEAPNLWYNDSKLIVYSLSDQFDIERQITSNKTICAVLRYQEQCIAMVCTEAIPFKHNIIKITPLPECMRALATPIESICLCRIGDKTAVNFVINAESLFKYINQCST